jgi:hypothetical protein
MTTDHQMAMAYAAQQEVITALQVIGEPDLAGRLERCMTGAAAMVGRSPADPPRVSGVVRR